MSLAVWLRPPRHLLVLLLAVTIAPATGLVWLGWRLLQQDRALAEQRVQEDRERAASLLVAALEQRLQAVECDLASPTVLRDLQPGDDAVLLSLGPERAAAVPPARLLYDPVVAPCRNAPASVFQAGEAQEFRFGNHAAAIASFRDLTRSSDAAVRAGAYLWIARNLRKAGQQDAALAAYGELARLGSTPLACVPADLVARRARCAMLAELNRGELRGEADALSADFRAGRWRLDRATYTIYAEDIRGWTGVDPMADRERLALTLGAEWLSDRWQAAMRDDARAAGRHSMEVEGRPLAILWTMTADGLVGLVAGPRYVEREWIAGLRTILSAEGVELALRDPAERAGSWPAPVFGATRRAASETGLPWTVVVSNANPGAETAQTDARRRLLLSGLVLMVILVSAGSYFTVRAFLRELAAVRLQSDFVAAVSHEFRTPLASLRQFTENLLDGRVATDERRLSYYRAQSRATERLYRLVEGLLDFGRMEAGVVGYRLDAIDAGELVRSVVEDFRQDLASLDLAQDASARHDHACHVELSVEPGTPVVRGDREAIARTLWNLLDNAVKYSPGCRTVWVDVVRESDEVAIRVRDSGLGIAPDEQTKVWRKFFRGAAATATGVKGTGIGLAMAQHVVSAHGGRLRLESAPGAGSTFAIALPIADSGLPNPQC